MHNERIVLWPALCLENLFYCFLIECVSTEAIDSLGGKHNKTAVFDDFGALFESVVCVQNFGHIAKKMF